MVKWSKTIQVQFTHAEMVNLNILPPGLPFLGLTKDSSGFLRRWFIFTLSEVGPLLH